MMVKPFYCISYFDGDLSWIDELCAGNYIVYSKGELPDNAPSNVVEVPNVGYNIYSYLTYIIDNYDALPEVIVFCKNNVFDRHVSREVFIDACSKNVYMPIEEQSTWKRLSFPVSLIASDGGFLEINNSWYVSGYERRYFYDFDKFYQFVFKDARRPDYIRFAPGANYVVPRGNVLLRSRNFYINLRSFVQHSQFSCESHYIERSLHAIWSSSLAESTNMLKVLTTEELLLLQDECKEEIEYSNSLLRRIKRVAFNKLTAFVYSLFR